MYRDSFSETPFRRFLKALSASFRLGRFFRVEVRVFYVALIVMPLVLLRNAKGLPFIEAATYIAVTTILLYVIIWVHEMGHIVAGRRYGVPTPLITLSPLGGLAHMSAGAPSPTADIRISLAGPATHAIWLLVFLAPWILFERGDFAPADWRYFDPVVDTIDILMVLNLGLLLFNLLPFFPMDGGRVFRAVLSKRMHPNRATLIACKVGMVGGIGFLLIGIALWILRDDLWGPILAMIGISNVMACKREKLAALHTPGPYMDQTLDPWAADPEAWKQGADDEEPKAPGLREKRKQARAEKRREKDAAAEAALQADVDRILDRVNEVGLDGLTAKEREILMKASKRRP